MRLEDYINIKLINIALIFISASSPKMN